MKNFLLRLLCLVLFPPLVAFAAKPIAAKKPAEAKPAPIRDFDIATLSRLGREIYLHDQLAWKATDVVFAQVGQERLQKDGARGWIVDAANPKAQVVRFLRLNPSGAAESLCDITFVDGDKPELSVPADRTLTPKQAAQAIALETAKARFIEAQLPWCGGSPNTVVLDDPDGSGFLVYLLRAKPSTEEVPIGGHYRLTVSADGKTVEQIDRLFVSCLTSSKRDVPAGSAMAGLVASHLVSPTPVETHVFLSLQENLPFMISTSDGTIWSIENGEISRQGSLKDGPRK